MVDAMSTVTCEGLHRSDRFTIPQADTAIWPFPAPVQAASVGSGRQQECPLCTLGEPCLPRVRGMHVVYLYLGVYTRKDL